MRILLLIAIAVLVNTQSFAQRASNLRANPINTTVAPGRTASIYARTTGVGDTLKLSNIPASDTTRFLYQSDSGYLTGTNALGDQGFAERYDINGADSSVQVIGVMAQFGGKVNPASTHAVSFHLWTVGTQENVTATYGYSGMPYQDIDDAVTSVTQLGIGATVDTMKTFVFDSGNHVMSGSFFIGYTINYVYSALAGDTIALASSANGSRTSPVYQLIYVVDPTSGDTTAVDTLVNVQNATQWSDNTWHDNYTDDDSLYNNLAIYPIVVIEGTTAVKGITRNDVTFFGNYPNPAVNSTNIKFSLAECTGITVQIMDMNGRILNTIPEQYLSAGEHIIPVNTADMSAGNYLYLIRTSGGTGIAGKMSVMK